MKIFFSTLQNISIHLFNFCKRCIPNIYIIHIIKKKINVLLQLYVLRNDCAFIKSLLLYACIYLTNNKYGY